MNSIPYLVAKAIVNGAISLDDMTAKGRAQTEAIEMAGRIKHIVDPALGSLHSIEPGVVEINVVDGRSFKKRIDFPRGHPKRPLSFGEIADKFRTNSSYARHPLGARRIDQIIDYVDHLETFDDVRDLVTLISGDRKGRV